MDNILTGDEAAALFTDEVEEVKQEDNTPDKQEENTTTEVSADELFDEEPESVGSEEEVNNQEEDATSDEDGSSPDNNFYSSIANALREEGVFPDLDDETIDKIKQPEDFRQLVQDQIQAGLHEAQQRVYQVLNLGVEPSLVQKFENALQYLNNITDAQIEDESVQGESLRKNLLIQDFIQSGYSQERAFKLTEKLVSKGEDIDEAKQALISNRERTQKAYEDAVQEAAYRKEQQRQYEAQQSALLKRTIMEPDTIYGSVPIDKQTRKQAYEFVTSPKYKDPQTGNYITGLQKYERENNSEYIKNVALLYTLTDGFKNVDKLAQPAAKKEVKSKLKELEHTLKNTNRGGGNLKYVGTSSKSKENISVFDPDFQIDLS